MMNMRPRARLRPLLLTVLVALWVIIGALILWSDDGNHSGSVIGIAGITYGFIAGVDAWAWPRLQSSNGGPERPFLFKPKGAFFVWAAIFAAGGVANLFEEDWSTWEPFLFFGIAAVLAAVGFRWAGSGSNVRPSD